MPLITLFKWTGFLEGISFLLLLFIAMPLKYWWGWPTAVKHVGMAHGVLFIAFCFLLALLVKKYSLSLKIGGLGLLAAFLPFGPFVYHRYLNKEVQFDSLV